MKRIYVAICVWLAIFIGAFPAHAQKTKAQLTTEINTNFADNSAGLITAGLLRSTLLDVVASYTDYLTCTTSGGVMYWDGTAAPVCLVTGTAGRVFVSGTPPSYVNISTLVLAGTGISVTGTTVTTVTLAPIADQRMMANISGGSAPPVPVMATSWFNSAFCNTIGRAVANVAGIWTCSPSIPVRLDWLGVVADGATDNSATFQAILNTMQAGVGGAVQLSPGTTCVFSGVKNITAGVPIRYIGTGGLSSVLSGCMHDSAPVLQISGATSTLDGVFIQGAGQPNDPTFGANFPALLVGPTCGGCNISNNYVVNGSRAISITSNDVRGWNNVSAYAYGTEANYCGGTGVAGVRLYNGSFDQALPFAASPPTSISAWAASTAYTAGAVVSNGTSKMMAMTSGTSGGSLPALKNYFATITDNTVTWQFAGKLNYSALNADSGCSELYITEIDMSGSAYSQDVRITNNAATIAPFYIYLTRNIYGGPITNAVSVIAGSRVYITGGEFTGCFATACDNIQFGSGFTGTTEIVGAHITGALRAGVSFDSGAIGATLGHNTVSGNANGFLFGAGTTVFTFSANILCSNTSSAVISTGASDYYSAVGNITCGNAIIDNGTGTHKYIPVGGNP